jgi:hypothetical protein
MVFVSAQIVSDNVNIPAGIFSIQAFQERKELLLVCLSTQRAFTTPACTTKAAKRQVVPCLLKVVVCLSGLPGLNGSSGCDLSSA